MDIDVSIIIVNYKSSILINDCIRSIFEKTEGISYEIIVVDNATEDLSQVLDAFGDERVTTLQLKENVGFGRANNAGAELAKGRNLFLLNPDTVLINNAVKILSDYLDEHPEVGACGGNLFDENQKPGHSYRRMLPGIWWEINEIFSRRIERKLSKNSEHNYTGKPLIVSYITGADLMLRNAEFNNLNGFDPDFFVYFEETDLCTRIKRIINKKIISVPSAEIVHLVGKTVNGNDKRRAIMAKKMWENGRRLYLTKNCSIFEILCSNLILRMGLKYRIIRAQCVEDKTYFRDVLNINLEEWK